MFDSVTVIAFDLDDTLWPCMPTIHRAEKATYDWLVNHYPRITEQYSEHDFLEYRKNFMHSDEKYLVDLSMMRKDMLAQLAREFDYPVSLMSQQGFDLFYRLRHDVDYYDDVFPVLDTLKGRYRLGSISNGNASAGLTELDKYFDYYINAADIMVRKPNVEIFHAFCRHLDVEPEECLYVGDDAVYDVSGANAAGMRTVWLNRDAKVWPQEIKPAMAEIKSLFQLPTLL